MLRLKLSIPALLQGPRTLEPVNCAAGRKNQGRRMGGKNELQQTSVSADVRALLSHGIAVLGGSGMVFHLQFSTADAKWLGYGEDCPCPVHISIIAGTGDLTQSGAGPG